MVKTEQSNKEPCPAQHGEKCGKQYLVQLLNKEMGKGGIRGMAPS